MKRIIGLIACSILGLNLQMAHAQPSAQVASKAKVPLTFQGDWLNVADEKKRFRLCRQLEEDGYMPLPKVHALTFGERNIEQRFEQTDGNQIFMNAVNLRYQKRTNNTLTGHSEQEYQEYGADSEFPVRFNLPFSYTIKNNVLHAPHLKVKRFYPCPKG